MNAKKLGQFICTLRQETGLTQKNLADMLGVTDKAVSRWETGKNYPDIELFESIAQYLGVSVSELISGRRLDYDEIIPESDKNIVRVIKINRRQKRIFSMALALLLVFILISGVYTIGRISGLDGKPFSRTYDVYQRDLIAVLKEIEGRVYDLSSDDNPCGTLYISEADILFSPEKEIDSSAPMISHLSVTCSDNDFIYDIFIYPPRKESVAFSIDQKIELNICKYPCSRPEDSSQIISLECLIQLIDALDINSLHEFTAYTDFFSLTYCGVRNGEDIDLSINPASDYIFDGNTVKSAYSDEKLSGSYALFHLAGFTPDSAGGGYISEDKAEAFVWVP